MYSQHHISHYSVKNLSITKQSPSVTAVTTALYYLINHCPVSTRVGGGGLGTASMTIITLRVMDGVQSQFCSPPLSQTLND
jgi:hypothetical protein